MSDDVALVLEGGSYRSMFTAGVLDVLMERGVWGFSSVWGVSAGSLVGINYVSRQPGRAARINLAYRDDRRYLGLYQLASTGDIMSSSFLYRDIQDELDPFDFVAFNGSATSMYAIASDVVFGTPAYIEITELPEKTDYLRASASMPLFSRIVEVDGRRLLDGGTCDSVPAAEALARGADRAVVVLTRERGFQKDALTGATQALVRRTYADYPSYMERVLDRPRRYNEQRRELRRLEGQGKILAVCPDKPVTVGTSRHGGADLLDLYVQGRTVGARMVARVAEYLG